MYRIREAFRNPGGAVPDLYWHRFNLLGVNPGVEYAFEVTWLRHASFKFKYFKPRVERRARKDTPQW